MNIESRFDQIKRTILNSTVEGQSILNIDSLLDAFIILYDECSTSTLTSEKPVKEFLQYGERKDRICQKKNFVVVVFSSEESDDICEE